MHTQERTNQLEFSIPEVVVFVVLCFAVGIIIYVNVPRPIIYSPNATEYQSQKIQSTINLYVTGKHTIPWGTYGFYESYYLALSNGMDVAVTKAEYESYNLNESYNFEIEESITIRRDIKVKDAANPKP